MEKHLPVLVHTVWLELKRIIFGVKHFAEIDVTDNCNLRCKHCYHFYGKNDFRVKELDSSVWEKRFNELHRHGVRSILAVGGEPSLRPDVLKLADSIFPYVFVITNGMVKIPEKFNHRLFVSLDGVEKTNDTIRGAGVFSRVIKNYSGDDRVIVNMTVTRDNYREIEDVVGIAKENGFRGVVCNICAGGTDMNSPLVVRAKERKAIIEEMKRVKKLYPRNLLMSKAMIKWYESPDHRESCYWGDEVLHFDVSWNKRRCFGNNADCSNCGCLAGALQGPSKILRYPREMLRIILVP